MGRAMREAHAIMPQDDADFNYWEKNGWHGKERPWR